MYDVINFVIVWIYYTGYAEEATGNWCFKDGTITFWDVFTLYKKHLIGKILALYIDCCYSGQWVVDCAKCLDEMGIGACGHQAKEQKIFIRIIASCEPSQKATVENFLLRKGILFHDHYKTLFFCSSKKLTNFQTTYARDFTMITCLQWEGPTAPCRLSSIPPRCSWKWVDVVAVDHKDRPVSRIYLIKDESDGIDVWHYVLVDKEMLDAFHNRTVSDLSRYGHIIKSGWGRNPPSNVTEGILKCSPGYA